MARTRTTTRGTAARREARPREESKTWEWRIGEEVFDCEWVHPQALEGKPFRILKQKRSELNAMQFENGQPVGKSLRPFLLTLADLGEPVKAVFKLEWNEYRADLMHSIEMLEGCGLRTSDLTWELHKPRNYWAFRCVGDSSSLALSSAPDSADEDPAGRDLSDLEDIPF